MLCLISSALPPAIDGIGDYTANLAAELAPACTVSVLCGMQDPHPIAGVTVRTAFSSSQRSSVLRLAQQVARERPDAVVLEYCPFSYGRWGINPYLPMMLRRVRRSSPGVRIAVTVHEPLAWPITWRLKAMNLAQRPQLRAICRAADVVLCTVGRWAQDYSPLFGGRPVHHLPVGSNIALAAIDRTRARYRLSIAPEARVVAIFGQGHHSQMWEYAARAVEGLRASGTDVTMLHLGPRSERVADLSRGATVISDGFLPADELSRRLAAADVFLAPFADGVSTRRTTLMAALQHGIPTVGTYGYATDSVLRNADGYGLLLTPPDDASAFADAVDRVCREPELARRLSLGGSALFEHEFSWPVIAKRLLSALVQPRASTD